MTAAKKRNLFEEIREGLEAYRDRRDALSRRKLSAGGWGEFRLVTSAKKPTCRRKLG